MLNEKEKITLDSKLEFGKYCGSKISEILVKDPKYIKWCLEKNIFGLSENDKEILEISIVSKQDSYSNKEFDDSFMDDSLEIDLPL